MLFCEHLITRGLVSTDQVLEALDYQKSNWAPIGKIAISKRMITIKQVFDILNRQATSTKKFGEIACELGYLVPDDVDRLLVMQREENLHVGEVLVKLNYLEREVLLKELLIFLKLTEGRSDLLANKLAEAAPH